MRSSAVDEADLENSRGDQRGVDRSGAAAPAEHHRWPCLRIPTWRLLVQILAEAENVGVAAFEAAIGGHHNGVHRADAAAAHTHPLPPPPPPLPLPPPPLPSPHPHPRPTP